MRNSHTGKINNISQSIDETEQPKKKSPTKKSKAISPSRG